MLNNSFSQIPPKEPKIYHITHIDNLRDIITSQGLFSDAHLINNKRHYHSIGLREIKKRRLSKFLSSYPDLSVGACVPFYFCPRSVMLYLIYKKREDLGYYGGQEPIVHLEADMHQTIKWATKHQLRWVFTDINASTNGADDYANIKWLHRIDWDAINTRNWREVRDHKQAEFLIEDKFHWRLIDRIGVQTPQVYDAVRQILTQTTFKPRLEIIPEWYY